MTKHTLDGAEGPPIPSTPMTGVDLPYECRKRMHAPHTENKASDLATGGDR